MNKVFHGWYSQTQSRYGIWKYSTPNGKEVLVTHVTDTKEHTCLFEDMKYVGEVTNLIKVFFLPRITF